jgi:hypothetical protein
VFKRKFESRPEHADGGIAHYDVQAAKFLAECREGISNTLRLTHVCLKRQHTPAQLAYCLAHRFRFLLTGVVNDGHVATRRGKFEGNGAPNAAGGTCHERNSIS